MKFELTVPYKTVKRKGVIGLEPYLPKAVNGKPYHSEIKGNYNEFDKTVVFEIDTKRRD